MQHGRNGQQEIYFKKHVGLQFRDRKCDFIQKLLKELALMSLIFVYLPNVVYNMIKVDYKNNIYVHSTL